MVRVQLVEKLDYERLEERIDKYIEDAINSNRQLTRSLDQLLTAGLSEDSLNEMTFNIVKTSEEDTYISRKISKFIKELLHAFRNSRENLSEKVASLKKQIEVYNSRLISLKGSFIKDIKGLELEQSTNIGLSLYKFQMDAKSIEDVTEEFSANGIETNTKIIEHILKDGDKSLVFPDSYVFEAVKVSNLVKYVLQKEKIGIVSSNDILGDFYIPNFHDKDGNVLTNNDELRQNYVDHLEDLNNRFIYFSSNGISEEDARNILPCGSLTNLVFSVDAMKLKDLIIKLVKTEYASIPELYVFGKRLYEIAKEKVPFIIAEIDDFVPTLDEGFDFMDEAVGQLEGKEKTEESVVDIRPSTKNIDDTILISSIMNRYKCSYQKAKGIYNQLVETIPGFRKKLMKAIASSSDDLETVMFDVNANISLNALDKLNAYADILPCDISSSDLTSFITPLSIKCGNRLSEEYNEAFRRNIELCNTFEQKYGVRKEDLVYFVANGNKINTLIRFNGKSLRDFVLAAEKRDFDSELKVLAKNICYELNRLEGAVLYSATLENQSGSLKQVENEDPQRLLELKIEEL